MLWNHYIPTKCVYYGTVSAGKGEVHYAKYRIFRISAADSCLALYLTLNASGNKPKAYGEWYVETEAVQGGVGGGAGVAYHSLSTHRAWECSTASSYENDLEGASIKSFINPFD